MEVQVKKVVHLRCLPVIPPHQLTPTTWFTSTLHTVTHALTGCIFFHVHPRTFGIHLLCPFGARNRQLQRRFDAITVSLVLSLKEDAITTPGHHTVSLLYQVHFTTTPPMFHYPIPFRG